MKQVNSRLWQLLFALGTTTLGFIAYAEESNTKAVGNKFQLNAVVSCGNAKTQAIFTSATVDTCNVDNNGVVQIKQVGAAKLCSITMSYAAFGSCKAGVQQYTYTLVKGTSTLKFTPAVNSTVGETVTLSAEGIGSTKAVTFASTTTKVCTVLRSNLSFIAEGTCTVTANQEAGDNYNAVTTPVNITVKAKPVAQSTPKMPTVSAMQNSSRMFRATPIGTPNRPAKPLVPPRPVIVVPPCKRGGPGIEPC